MNILRIQPAEVNTQTVLPKDLNVNVTDSGLALDEAVTLYGDRIAMHRRVERES